MWRSRVLLTLLVPLAILAGGCASDGAQTQRVAWDGGPEHGRSLLTPHYVLYTTVEDEGFLSDLVATMEEAHRQYRKLAPTPGRERRLEGYVFAYRQEWVDFTQATAGPLAPVYLQIHRGGYAHGDVFATFHHGGPQTLAVCRHEGWHQYVASGFRHRPPPFIEEGLATLFEEGFEGGSVARPRSNGTRQLRLAEAVRRQRAWPLRTLLGMHAGDVIGSNGPEIDTFYAQAWALARFLLEDERYHDGFRRLLAAYAQGSVGRVGVIRALEVHLGVPFEQLEADYEAYVRRLSGADARRRRDQAEMMS